MGKGIDKYYRTYVMYGAGNSKYRPHGYTVTMDEGLKAINYCVKLKNHYEQVN